MRLGEQVKPTVSVLLLGGLDGIFNIVFNIVIVLLIGLENDPLVKLYLFEFLAIPLQWLQIMCHPLVYGLYMTAIHKRILDFDWYVPSNFSSPQQNDCHQPAKTKLGYFINNTVECICTIIYDYVCIVLDAQML